MLNLLIPAAAVGAWFFRRHAKASPAVTLPAAVVPAPSAAPAIYSQPAKADVELAPNPMANVLDDVTPEYTDVEPTATETDDAYYVDTTDEDAGSLPFLATTDHPSVYAVNPEPLSASSPTPPSTFAVKAPVTGPKRPSTFAVKAPVTGPKRPSTFAVKAPVTGPKTPLVKQPAVVSKVVQMAKTGSAVQVAKLAGAVHAAGDKAGAKAILKVAKAKAKVEVKAKAKAKVAVKPKASLKFKIGEVVGAIRTIDHDRIDKMYEDAIVQMSTGNPSVSIPAALRRASHNLNIMGGRPGCRHYAAQTLAKITDAAFNAAKHHKAAGTL